MGRVGSLRCYGSAVLRLCGVTGSPAPPTLWRLYAATGATAVLRAEPAASPYSIMLGSSGLSIIGYVLPTGSPGRRLFLWQLVSLNNADWPSRRARRRGNGGCGVIPLREGTMSPSRRGSTEHSGTRAVVRAELERGERRRENGAEGGP
ncbi:hypothetical protein Psi01_26810 [Planobispora siamensis]|uniref:Uncharacterized protein n=1 Tax=Planobispora siamensis TaxID=936338 RepID=A0A8J3SCB7_9ACTN|nr:hypothetical protein Psi01_26810 [Planobispora siamensis]